MHALATARGGRLHVAVFPTAGAALMPAAIAAFIRQHPEVELRLTEEETPNALRALDRHEVDLVVGYDFTSAPEGAAGIHRTELLDDTMHLALPAGHPLAGDDQVPIRALAHETWVSSRPDEPCSRALAAVCAAAGFVPQVTYRSDDYATVQELVAAGVGIATVPRMAADHGRADIAFRTTSPALAPRRVFCAATPHLTAAAAAMTAILVTLATELVAPSARR